jgi:hypothetical protein
LKLVIMDESNVPALAALAMCLYKPVGELPVAKPNT